MSLMIVRYSDSDAPRWARLLQAAPTRGTELITIEPIVTNSLSTGHLIGEIGSGGNLATTASRQIRSDQLLSPITGDASLVCQGLNYRDHAAEAQLYTRRSNLIFAKSSSSLTGAFASIVRPSEVELLDYEVEIGVVLRTDLRGPTAITDANIGQIVAGVVLCNDVSARDTMFGATFMQWYLGKSYRTFCPAGPVLYLLEPDDVAPTLLNLKITLSLNGELRQSASSAQLIYGPAETLAYLSERIDLNRGDVLLTGTPGGVTSPASPKLVEILKVHLMADEVRQKELRAEMVKFRPFLGPGDVVTATLEDTLRHLSLGGQENVITAAGNAVEGQGHHEASGQVAS